MQHCASECGVVNTDCTLASPLCLIVSQPWSLGDTAEQMDTQVASPAFAFSLPDEVVSPVPRLLPWQACKA